MRVDGLEERVPACDNMTSKGTTEWALLDVSEQAEANSAMAWLSLVVAYSIIIGFG